MEQLLWPLCRLLLRHAVPFAAFEEMAKRVYVRVAMKDLAIPGKKPTMSRAAVLSGLTRKEVQRIVLEQHENVSDVADRYNRAARVLTGWVRDADFSGADGAPRRLELEGDRGFAGLVKRHSGDMPWRAVLDELLRVGAVEQGSDARLQLVTHAYVPQHSEVDKLDILGRDVSDLIDTIDHNLQHGAADPRFQRKVMYDAIPVSALPALRQLSGRDAQALLEKLDQWLAERDIEAQPGSADVPRARVGLGIYYFEERLEPRLASHVTPGGPR